MKDTMYVARFMFCKEHGSELCHKCCYDFRITNNMSIEEQFPNLYSDEFADRPPITDVYAFGVVPSKRKLIDSDSPSDPVYECKQHSIVDCSDCFNWSKLVAAKMKAAVKQQQSSGVALETNRAEKLGMLIAMGVELSPATRLPDKEIINKLYGAIDTSQAFNKVTDAKSLDPSSLPIWSASQSKSVYESIRRGNLAEAMRNFAHGDKAFPLYQNAFMDVRQTLMSLARNWDNGLSYAVLQDKNNDFAICMRVVNVHVLKNDVPLLVVLYERGTRATPIQSTLSWIQEMITKTRNMPQITATLEEQVLLLTILNLNAKRMSANYDPKRKMAEKTFKLSFLLPMGPLSQIDIGRLTHNTGCVLCGSKTTKRCTACLAVEYCGPDCQKSHWKEHKPLCHSLKGGTWTRVKVTPESPEMRKFPGKKFSMAYINHSSTEPIQMHCDGTITTPPNIHGDRPFMVKIQKPYDSDGNPAMLIYDRQRTIHLYIWNEENGAAWELAERAIRALPVGKRMKIYRWAKRIGELEMSICFDRLPAQDPQW